MCSLHVESLKDGRPTTTIEIGMERMRELVSSWSGDEAMEEEVEVTVGR